MPPKKRQLTERKIALCYVRQSYTRDAEDISSPERQRANISAECERNGWIPEWYQDADGHKSGTKEKNRPGWLALKARLGDPDVVALVANDLARLHRKGWRIGDLIDYLDEHDVHLVIAAPGRQIDLSSPQGRILVQFIAMLDEWYAADISQRAKDSVAHRRAQGKTIARPPFGTIRDEKGYLIPSPYGAWLMPNGSFVAGEPNDEPDPGAFWRGYYKCAERVMELYAEGNKGYNAVAYQMQIEGWAFCTRASGPRAFDADDARRVVLNWPEYGGHVMKHRATRRGYYQLDPQEIPLNEERAVFQLPLLRRVGEVLKNRSLRPVDKGVRAMTYPYPLNGITYCYHCEQLALQHNDPQMRTRLGGFGHPKTRRYRHREGRKCGCTNRSVLAEVYEADFSRLIKLLTVRQEAIDLMVELSIQSGSVGRSEEFDLETEKREAIALCRRRIEAAINLYGDGRIDRQEYPRRVEQNEREIAHWEARTTETEKIAIELSLCMDALDKIARLWDISEDEDKQGMARSLFTEVIYNLDTHRIVDFKLKPWADRFLVLRAALYGDENKNADSPNSESAFQGQYPDVAPTGFGARPLPSLNSAIQRVLNLLYWGIPSRALSDRSPSLEKNETKTFECGMRLAKRWNPWQMTMTSPTSGFTRLFTIGEDKSTFSFSKPQISL